MTKPIEEFIPRILDPELESILSHFGDGINELVNFGSHVFNWDVSQKIGSDERLPAALMLRNFLGIIDSLSILVRHSSIEPCNSLLRTALETYFYLEYLLDSNEDNRALAFIVWQNKNTLKFLEKLDGKSERGKQFAREFEKDKFLNQSDSKMNLNSEVEINAIESLLNHPKYKPINDEYDRVESKTKKKPKWFALFNGPNDLEQLAKKSSLNALYEVLYRNWSHDVHGTSILNGKLSRQGEFIQLRSPKDAQSITQHIFNLSIATFNLYLTKRVKHKLGDYKTWYKSIQRFYNSLGEGQYIKVE